MAILNYTTEVAADRSADQIMTILRKHGALAILAEYTSSGDIQALSFKVNTPLGIIPFRLPVNVAACQKVLYLQYQAKKGPSFRQTQPDHARKVAWRILKDWVEAQMAILDTEMVKMEQVFLPYATTRDGKTLYDHMIAGGFKALGAGKEGDA